MADLLSSGISGLLAYRRSLDTVSNNIANANTPGYSRQRVELVSRPGTGYGFGYIGSGVDIGTVRRLGDSLLNTRVQSDASAYTRLEAFSGYASRLDRLLSDAEAGLSAPLSGFFDAANALAQNPSSTSARQALLGSADTLAVRFRETQAQIDGMDREINQRLRSTVDEINGLTRAVGELNAQIAQGYGEHNGQPPNDLLDRRDQLLNELSSRIGITTVSQDDGSLNVFTASGQALVLGRQSTSLGVVEDEFGSGRLDIVHGGGARITAQLSGGSLGGLIDARRELLDPARAQLGRLAVGVAQSVNAQHAQGVDLTGALGGEFFAAPQGAAYGARTNTGSAEITVGFGDLGQLGDGDYQLRYDGATWTLTSARNGASVALTGSGSAADPLVGGGLELVVSGAAAAGDRYWLRPTAEAAGQMQVALRDPARIAAADPLRATAALANTGSAGVSTPVLDDASNPALLDPVTLTFTAADRYQINGSGSYVYSAGTPISVNGWSLSLTGTPAAGDAFSVAPAGAGNGGNANAQALAALGGRGVFDGGRTSVLQAHTALVSGTGSQAQQAQLRLDAQAAVQQQTLAERESAAGVNLDEEAADLIRYQQAYQAAARVIQVADTLFQTLLQAAGR